MQNRESLLTFFLYMIFLEYNKIILESYCTVSLPVWGGTEAVQFSSVQSLSHVRLFATPWIAAHQASLSITNSRSSLRLTSIESVMPSSHLIFCRPLLLLPPIPPSITVFSNESTLCMRWPKYWSFSFSIIRRCQTWGFSQVPTAVFPLLMWSFFLGPYLH